VDEIIAGKAVWRTELWLAARGHRTPAVQRWLQALLDDEVAALDRLASRFRPDSQVSAVNRGAGHWVEVSWDFVAVLTACLRAAEATDGLCDPLLGGQVVAAGYDAWAAQDSGIGPMRSDARHRDIEISPGRAQAQVRIPAGSALDLGAVAKGWLADRLATTVHASTGWDCVANMGGDLRVVSPHQPWLVGAEADDGRCVNLEVTDAGLATSGVGHRRWHGGHHLIDPRTGAPADTCWTSVSVLAGTAADANAAATAAMVLGEQATVWLQARSLDAWCVGEDRQDWAGRWRHWREAARADA
jgi:thiamine biosynthesis lipoprotein